MTARGAGRALLLAGLVLPVLAWLASLAFGREVTLLARRHDASEEAEARRIRDPRDDVAEVYGTPEPGPPVRVLFPAADRLLVPAEDPSRTLYGVDRRRGESALLARTAVAGATGAGALLAVAGAACLFLSRRKS